MDLHRLVEESRSLNLVCLPTLGQMCNCQSPNKTELSVEMPASLSILCAAASSYSLGRVSSDLLE